jgi:hypothetical protein
MNENVMEELATPLDDEPAHIAETHLAEHSWTTGT